MSSANLIREMGPFWAEMRHEGGGMSWGVEASNPVGLQRHFVLAVPSTGNFEKDGEIAQAVADTLNSVSGFGKIRGRKGERR